MLAPSVGHTQYTLRQRGSMASCLCKLAWPATRRLPFDLGFRVHFSFLSSQSFKTFYSQFDCFLSTHLMCLTSIVHICLLFAFLAVLATALRCYLFVRPSWWLNVSSCVQVFVHTYFIFLLLLAFVFRFFFFFLCS